MDFDLSEEQRSIQGTARDFAAEELAPYAARWDEEKIFPLETLLGAAELGFAVKAIPIQFGVPAMEAWRHLHVILP